MDDLIQRILIQGDASSAIKAFGDLQRAMHDYRASAAQVVDTGDKIIDGNGAATGSILGLTSVGPALGALGGSRSSVVEGRPPVAGKPSSQLLVTLSCPTGLQAGIAVLRQLP